MQIRQQFHIASVAKMMTATRVLQLAVRGMLGPAGIDARLAEFSVLPPDMASRLNQYGGNRRGTEVTVRQLLTHTAGLRDGIVDDAQQCGGPAPDSLIGRILASPARAGHCWQPWNPDRPDDPAAGVINFFFATGIASASLSAPGESFHYSDTGYLLLALLVEVVSGQRLHEGLRESVLIPARMEDTYLAYREDPTLGPLRQPEAEVYLGDMPVLASGASLSFDWGGGGLVSTLEDLARFFAALRQGRLFQDPSTLVAMTDWITPRGLKAPRIGVGLGLFRLRWNELECWGHAGAWGARVEYFPKHDLLFVGTTNQARTPSDWHLPFVRASISDEQT